MLYHSRSAEKGNILVDILFHRGHFYLIRNVSRLIARKRTSFVCRSCLTLYSSQTAYENHKRFCDNKGVVFELPSDESCTVKFTNLESQMMKPFALYFDFETGVKPVLEMKKSQRKYVHLHVPLAVGARRICTNNSEYNSDVFISLGESC